MKVVKLIDTVLISTTSLSYDFRLRRYVVLDTQMSKVQIFTILFVNGSLYNFANNLL